MRWVLFWLLMFIALVVQVGTYVDWKFGPEPFSEPWLPKPTESDERHIRNLIKYHWPTAGQITDLRSQHLIWSEGNARVAHVVLDVCDESGTWVRERRLLSFRIPDDHHVQLSPSWVMPTSDGYNAADLDSALKANQFGPYSTRP
jgi:hypothetical protein